MRWRTIMENKKNSKYCPDIAIPPGDTLLEVIESMNLTQADLAERMNRPKKTINEIIKGKAAITPETAIQLERVLNVPARFWNNLEMNYQEDLARIAEKEHLAEKISWLENFPIKKMIKLKLIEDVKDKYLLLENLLSFFGVASIEAWERNWNKNICTSFSFRKSTKCKMDSFALAAWLRAGEVIAQEIKINKFNKKAFLDSIPKIRELTITEPSIFVPEIKKICSACGVVVLFIPELPNMPVHGLTRWVSSEKVIVQLSLRYKTDDQLWFSFFHEAGHILKHGKRDFIYGDFSYQDEEAWETEANQFALECLLSKDAYRYFVSKGNFSAAAVKEFAASQRIAPGIVVGRLQHDKHIEFSNLNNLKSKFEWVS